MRRDPDIYLAAKFDAKDRIRVAAAQEAIAVVQAPTFKVAPVTVTPA